MKWIRKWLALRRARTAYENADALLAQAEANFIAMHCRNWGGACNEICDVCNPFCKK